MLPLILALAAASPWAPAHAQSVGQPVQQTLAPVVVTATRAAQWSFDLPMPVDQLSRAAIRDDQPLMNLSESLIRVPGIIAQNRQNYAQDLQISSRGFGARASFGVRGLRMYVDGIPATMPDGQGQVSHIDLASADRIEVLRGPFTALYGNSAGGVIAVFTENGQPGNTLQADSQAGGYRTLRAGLKASGQQPGVNYVVSGSRFITDGYRIHSAANRNTANAKLRLALDGDSLVTLVGNAIRMRDVDDPLGLNRAQFDTDPRGADVAAPLFNTRKSIEQQQLGLSYERPLRKFGNLQASLYGGQRTTRQFQSIPVAVQAAPTQSGGMIDLEREYWGIDARWTYQGRLAGAPLQWTAGLNYDRLNEDRRGFENFIGGMLGVQGRLRRDEANRIFNFDQYAQAQWEPGRRWLLAAGIRHSSVHIRSADRYIVAGNGDDSGRVRFRAYSPALGATFRLSPQVNFYASFGKGFETPTFNELSYRSVDGGNTGMNLGLAAARSDHLEFGAKAQFGRRGLASAAVFRIDTENELTVLSNAGGRAVYQNAGSTRRTGLELALQQQWEKGIGTLLSYSWLRAEYGQSFCNGACNPATRVAAGNRLPGVPRHAWFGELSWRPASAGWHAALETRYLGRIMVDDVNSDAAPAHAAVNARAGYAWQTGPWQWKGFIRIDNLANRRYAGSVIVNESNRRYFEPAPGRNYTVGISLAHRW